MAKKRESLMKTSEIKKSLNDFLANEDGYVSKETILKIGLGTVAGLGILGGLAANASHTSHAQHTNNTGFPMGNYAGTECPIFTPTHANIPGHASHSSY